MEKSGSYQNKDVIWHQHSNKLLIELMKYFNQDIPVIDLGCGHNWYSNTLKILGYSSIGVDNTYFPGIDSKLDITTPIKKIIDARFVDGAPKKWNVLSLEVGEHIPAKLSEEYLNNVCSFEGDVCISWAVPGQEGIGHINCQTNQWVINQMLDRGYVIETKKTEALRDSVFNCHCNWFKNTLMYFVKNNPCE